MLRVLCLPNGKMTCMHLQNLSRTVRYSHGDCVQRPCPQASWMYLYNCTHVVTTNVAGSAVQGDPFLTFQEWAAAGHTLDDHNAREAKLTERYCSAIEMSAASLILKTSQLHNSPM